MASLLNGTLNTRNILPDNLHFIRSDVPVNLTVNDIQWLIDNNVLTIIDLREEKERAAKPCPLSENNCFTYISWGHE